MNRNEFLSELEESLKGKMTSSELSDILSDYNTFFDDGLKEGKTEDQVAKSLGSPARLAKTLLEDNTSEVVNDSESRIPHVTASHLQQLQTV